MDLAVAPPYISLVYVLGDNSISTVTCWGQLNSLFAMRVLLFAPLPGPFALSVLAHSKKDNALPISKCNEVD